MSPGSPSARRNLEESPSARFYLCLRCRSQALICLSCDRGQIYCTHECAKAARKERQRSARRRYQASARGRAMHVDRSRRFRERQRSVTDQGSHQPVAASLRVDAVNAAPPRRALTERHHFFCNGCACAVSDFVRRDILPQRKPMPRRGKSRSGGG